MFVDIDVHRVVAWPSPDGWGEAEVYGEVLPSHPDPQRAPGNGTRPRINVAKAAGQISVLPHRVLAWKGSDGFPLIDSPG